MRYLSLLLVAGCLLGISVPADAQVVSLYDVIYRPPESAGSSCRRVRIG